MGVSEYGYKRGDGTDIVLSCDPNDNNRLYLSAAIEGTSPVSTFVVFTVDGKDFEFRADELGSIEVGSRVSENWLYSLFHELGAGKELELRFSPHSIFDGVNQNEGWKRSVSATTSRTLISLAGSRKALGKSLC